MSTKITEVTKDGKVIGFRLVDNTTTYDWLKTKMCSNMFVSLTKASNGTYELPQTGAEDKIETANYKVAHTDADFIKKVYYDLETNTDSKTVYVKNGLAFFLYNKVNGEFKGDILLTTPQAYDLMINLGIVDEHDRGEGVNFLYTSITDEMLNTLKTYAHEGRFANTEICYSNKLQLIKREAVGMYSQDYFMYDADSLDDLIKRSNLNVIEC